MIQKLHWEETICEWCNTPGGVTLFEGPDRLLKLPGNFRVVQCECCGLIRQNPRLSWGSLRHYYPSDYDSYAPIIDEEPSRLRRWDRRYGMWKRLRAIERLKPGGYLLDVGCGTGIFLAEAIRRRRWEVIGVEPNEYAATYARQRLGINIFIERFTKVHLPAGAFDIITMWNVLEHFDKPIANLRYAYHLLHDGGWLVLSIPNLESLDARLFGAYWVGWDLPRHLYLFPRRVLRNILTQIGFTVQGMRCISTSYAALGHSLDFWSQKWANKCPSLIKALLRIYRTLPVRAALILPLRFLDQINFSSIITIFAQKGVPKRS